MKLPLRRVTALLTVGLLFLLPSVDCARDWANTAAQVEKSVVLLTHREVVENPFTGKEQRTTFICTGFSINEAQAYFFTAYHCLNNGTAADLKIDGHPARLLYANKELDLAVITADLHKPALRYNNKPLRKGDEIATLGHGHGFNETLFRAGYVAHPSIDLSTEFGPDYVGLWLVFSTTYIGGMSGGPVFGLDGRVVGVVQQGDEYSGYGLNMATILDATGFYWRK